MKRCLLILLFLCCSVWFGIQVQKDPGYVMISYHHYTVEMSFWVAVFFVCVMILGVHFFYRCLNSFFGFNAYLNEWRSERRIHKARKQLNRGLMAMAEGNWSLAERLVSDVRSESCENPLMHYLSAAFAAQKQGAVERRDNYLRQAFAANPKAEIAIGLTQSRLQLENNQFEQALATLQHLYQSTPKHRYVLMLLAKLYETLNDWKNLLKLLPGLRKKNIFSEKELLALETKTYESLLKDESYLVDEKKLNQFWNTIPRSLRKTDLVKAYVKALVHLNAFQRAERVLRDTLGEVWDISLLELYCQLPTGQIEETIQHLKVFEKNHKEDPFLLRCIGRLYRENKMWGKAKQYLENSLYLKPTKECYFEIALLMEKLNNQDAALEYYRSGYLCETTAI